MLDDTRKFTTDVARRLRCSAGHLRGIAEMIEGGADCEGIVRQTLAVQAALREVNRMILKHHLDVCVRERLNELDAAAREKYISELVALYQLLGATPPLERKKTYDRFA